ncbi:interferon-induced protein 44-like isoform X2 [Engraulis encrasicolus]|uniref:interferon-induced protein 44-like isoform X2 n=1 Tax=Engraulis encrasicolus TaxID=184585 RepID=UPI002FCE8D15
MMGEKGQKTGFSFGGFPAASGSSDGAAEAKAIGGFAFAAVPAATPSDAAAESKAARPRRAELVAVQKERAKNETWDFLNETPWRQVNWSDETRTALLESVRSYKPACGSVPAARVLLVGPVGAGKSSFISSVQSVLYGRVLNRAMVGPPAGSSTSFTKKLQSYRLHSSGERGGERGGESLAVVLSDMAGLGEGGGLTLHDTLAVIKGHVPDGHTFSALSPVGSDTAGYVKEPCLANRVHCVAYVVNAAEISTYSKSMTSTLQQLREHVSALGVHQVALVTHVDKVYVNTTDMSQVYRSTPLKNVMQRASAVLGMPMSSMVPVKNYFEELDPELHTDTLLLQALQLILQYVDLHLREHAE